jgi:hypothetical protein
LFFHNRIPNEFLNLIWVWTYDFRNTCSSNELASNEILGCITVKYFYITWNNYTMLIWKHDFNRYIGLNFYLCFLKMYTRTHRAHKVIYHSHLLLHVFFKNLGTELTRVRGLFWIRVCIDIYYETYKMHILCL